MPLALATPKWSLPRARGAVCLSLGIALAALQWGCGKPPAAGLDAAVVARVGSNVITAETFTRELSLRAKRQPLPWATSEGKPKLLDEMINREALYARATAAGFDQAPEMRQAIKNLIINRFQEVEAGRRPAAPPVSDQAISAYYSAHREKYSMPAQVHAAAILIRRSASASPATEAAALAKAQRALQEVRGQADSAAWRQAALAYSDDLGTRYRGGDLGWFTKTAGPWGWEQSVVDAAFDQSTTDEPARLITTSRAYYIIQILGTRPAQTQPLEAVREGIRYLLEQDAERKQSEDFYAGLRAGLPIVINHDVMDLISVTSAPASAPVLPLALTHTPSEPGPSPGATQPPRYP